MTNTAKNARTYRSSTQWQQLVQEYETSGLTQTAFCQQRGIAKSNLYRWRRKLQVESTEPAAFIDISPSPNLNTLADQHTPSASHWEVELDLGGGRVLRLRTI